MFDWIDRTGQVPTHVRCKKWQQAGCDVYSAPCPSCQPNVLLEADPRELGIHLDGEGRGECQRCKSYVAISLDGPEKES